MSTVRSSDSATIGITNLRLRTTIGANDWERESQQDVIVNLRLTFDPRDAVAGDSIDATVDYKKAKRRVMDVVENSKFFLVESLVNAVGKAILEDPRVDSVTVRIDKPHALRFADSVWVEMTMERTP